MKTLLGMSAPHIREPEFELRLYNRFQLPRHVEPERQQVMTQAHGPLPLTKETGSELFVSGTGHACSRLWGGGHLGSEPADEVTACL